MIEGASLSGVLTISSDKRKGFFVFCEGEIVAASCESSLRTGDALVARGAITEEELRTALGLQRRKKSGEPIGTILVDFKLVAEAVTREVLREQCVEVYRECASWKEGTLEFQRCEVRRARIEPGVTVGMLQKSQRSRDGE